MKPIAVATACLGIAVSLAPAQPVRVYSVPPAPSREALDRLNLKQAWRAKVPTEGRRDGIASIQLVPGKTNPQFLVQTLSGRVAVLDAETGDLLWSTAVGRPYYPTTPMAHNPQVLLTMRREFIHVLDRETGRQLLYDVDPDSKLPIWGMKLDGVPGAALVADEESVYTPFLTRVASYFVPNFRLALKAPKIEDKEKVLEPSPQLERIYNQILEPTKVVLAPFLTRDFLCLAGTDGTFLSLNKLSGEEIFRYKLESPISAGMAQHDSTAYVGAEDYHVYAFDVGRGRVVWRFSGGAPIFKKVEANDLDVFATPERQGMHRLDRKTGRLMWKNPAAERMVACNAKFVYAVDAFGDLLVLDHERGTRLAHYAMRDWAVPISNDLTDRLYFAAHDGSILCLHHSDLKAPLRMKTSPESIIEKPKIKPKEKPPDPKKIPEPKEKTRLLGPDGSGSCASTAPPQWIGRPQFAIRNSP